MAENKNIEMGNGMSLRPLDDPLMGRIHHTTKQVLEVVAKKAARPPASDDPTSFALNVLVSALATVTDEVRKKDPGMHRRCIILTMNMGELQALLNADGKEN